MRLIVFIALLMLCANANGEALCPPWEDEKTSLHDIMAQDKEASIAFDYLGDEALLVINILAVIAGRDPDLRADRLVAIAHPSQKDTYLLLGYYESCSIGYSVVVKDAIHAINERVRGRPA